MTPATNDITPTPAVRRRLVVFLIRSADELQVRHIVKYSALSLFADRFYHSLSLSTIRRLNHWLLRCPIRESNLQLFALISLWISSKSHESPPVSLRSMKAHGDKLISEQVFTKSDFIQAELIFMRSVRFEIGTSITPFALLEELIFKIRVVAVAGELVDMEACLDIMDLLYETEEFMEVLRNPILLAGSILVAAYTISVPKQNWEFPVVPWVKFITAFQEEEIMVVVKRILHHVLGLTGTDDNRFDHISNCGEIQIYFPCKFLYKIALSQC